MAFEPLAEDVPLVGRKPAEIVPQGRVEATGEGTVTAAVDATDTLDQATLEALCEGMATVLAERSGSTDLHAFIDGKNTLDTTLWTEAGALGWLGVGIPEQHGGLGMGARGLAILHGELGRQAAPGPFIATLSAAQAIVEAGETATQATWLARLASGEISAAVPARLDATPLTRSAAGISGTLRCLGAPTAAFVLAPVGNAWAIIELVGASITPIAGWDRTRQLFDLQLTDADAAAILPASTREILSCAMALAIAADSAGAARSITERTIDYMKARQQFGQPIAGFQALKHRAADLATRLAVMDEIVAHAVERVATHAPDADIWAVLAKSEVTETTVFVTTDCVQLHGGVGFTWDFDPHIFLKRARLNEVLMSSNLTLRDQAAAAMTALTRVGRSVLELGQ